MRFALIVSFIRKETVRRLEIILAAYVFPLTSGNTRRKSPPKTLIPRLSYIAPLKDIAGVMQVLQDNF